MDHPRTRGVYGNEIEAATRAAGSSPHTRGLPGVLRDAHDGTRIIPAHAGFTPRPGRGRAAAGIIPAHAGFTADVREWESFVRDHPRTRGVYAELLGLGDHGDRIIPAHAGFTRSSSS